MQPTRFLLIGTSLVLALTAGCGGGADQATRGVASLDGASGEGGGGGGRGGGGGSARTGADAALQDAMVAFAKCMRGEGIDFPDPGSDGGGALVIGPGSAIDPEDPDFRAAEATCKPILDEAEAEMPKPSDEELAEMRDRFLAFARCMREHGVDFPDPRFDGEGRTQMGMGDADDPDFEEAQEACSKEHGGIGIGRAPAAKGSR